jgi:hypothetical protein
MKMSTMTGEGIQEVMDRLVEMIQERKVEEKQTDE